MADRVGQQFGNYRLVRLLGQGAFADVYLAEHIHLGTQAAVKVLSMRMASDDVEYFRTEARIIASLVHPHIIRVLDFGIEDNIPYLIMEYASNGSLRQHYPKGTRLPLDTVIHYVKQIAAALQYAHEKKLIHRDIKPENLLLSANHQVLLSDFGVALFAQSTHDQNTLGIAGTVAYMAPEQLRGKPRRASDQYALGIVIYEWICGERPFQGLLPEIYSQQLFVVPPSLCEKVPELPSAVEEVVLTALAKDPEQRFVSVQAFATALAQACYTAPPHPVALLPENTNSDQFLKAAMVSAPIGTELPTNDGYPPEMKLKLLTSGNHDGMVKVRPIQEWHIRVRQGVTIALGSFLFGFLSQFSSSLQLSGVPSFLSSFPILPAIVIPVFFGTIFGSWIGLLTGGVGYLVGHYISGSPFLWSSNLDLAVIGYIAGIAKLKTKGRYNNARTIVIADLIGAIGVVIGTACGVYGNLRLVNFSVGKASIVFIEYALSDVILCLILLPILLVAHHIVVRGIERYWHVTIMDIDQL